MQEQSGRTPTVSRVFDDGAMIELVYDAASFQTRLAYRLPGGEVSLEDAIELSSGETLVPYSPRNNLLTSGCVLLPSAIGEAMDKADLLAEIKRHLGAYVDLSPLFMDIAAHYVLLSWVHDAFNELPYLRFQGEFGTGKTRALLAIGSLCYKPIFASGASTVSPLFHLLHEFGGTLVLDEADLRFSDATADLTKILNNGTVKGMPVLRTMTNRHRELNPHAFTVFGPKLIAMREGFQDEALESRFLTENTTVCQMRADIPINLPDGMKSEALDLRNGLLRWRFESRNHISVDPARAIDSLSARSNQTALALLSLIDDPALRGSLGTHLAMAEARGATRRAALPHIAMVGVLYRRFAKADVSYVTVADAVADYNTLALENGDGPLTHKGAGYLIRAKLGLVTTKTRGVYVIPAHEKKKIADLAQRYGVGRDDQVEAANDRAAEF